MLCCRGCLQELGWLSVPISMVVSFLLFGIEEIGVQIEEPFGILEVRFDYTSATCEAFQAVAGSAEGSCVVCKVILPGWHTWQGRADCSAFGTCSWRQCREDDILMVFLLEPPCRCLLSLGASVRIAHNAQCCHCLAVGACMVAVGPHNLLWLDPTHCCCCCAACCAAYRVTAMR
jgi:hypothetical protein